MKTVSTILLGAALLTTVSCGNNKSSGSPKKEPKIVDSIVSDEGHYQATLTPINAHLVGDADMSGTATVKIKGDSLTVEVKVNGAPASMKHIQSIHLASECPTLSSDFNKDGVIDAVEGMKSYGKVLLPLDQGLADFSGNYFHRKSTSLTETLKDLKMNSGLSLSGKQIVIYGVAQDAEIPSSVATVNGLAKHSSLPIACGSFIKIAVDEVGTNTNGGKEE